MEGHAQFGAKTPQRVDELISAAHRRRTDRRRAGEQRPGLARLHVQARCEINRRGSLERQIVGLPADQLVHRLGQARQGPYPRLAVGQQHIERKREHGVAGQDRLTVAEYHPPGRPVSPFQVAVHDIVVQQGEVVDELHRDGRRHPIGERAACCFGTDDRERGPQRFAASVFDRIAELVVPIELIARH